MMDVRRRRTRRQNNGQTDGKEGHLCLIPVDTDSSRTGGSDANATIGLTLEPFQRPLVVPQVGFELVKASAIVILHPLLLLLGDHTILDHLGLDGDAGKSLEAEPAVAVELVPGLDSAHSEGGFDPDTPFARKI